MKKVTADVKNYDIGYQQYLLNQVYNCPEVFTRCKNILRPEYFDPLFRAGIAKVQEHTVKYTSLPTIDHIYAVYGMELKEITVQPDQHDAILDSLEEFCKHKAMENAIMNSAPLLQEKKYGAVEQLIKEAMLVSLQKDIGLDVYEDPTKVIQDLAAMQGTFKSGWDTLDYKLFGGFGRCELEIFAAASGGGKSVVLQNLAVNFSSRGVRGSYISLELAEELVANRIYGMMLDTASGKLRQNIQGTHSKIKFLEKTAGGLHVKRLPESITTVNDIEAYLRELMIRTGEKLDYVCVDYLDLLTSDRVGSGDNVFVKDKYVSEELRAMATKLDLTVFTAAQFNRSGVDADQKSQSQISGGISKIFTADNVIYIDAHKDRGEMVFDFQKTRNSSAVGSRLRMSYNTDSLRVTDHEDVVMEMEAYGDFKRSRNGVATASNVVTAPKANQTAMQSLKSNILSTRMNPLKAAQDAPVPQPEPSSTESDTDTPPWDESPPETLPSVPEAPVQDEALSEPESVEAPLNKTELKTTAVRAFLSKTRNR